MTEEAHREPTTEVESGDATAVESGDVTQTAEHIQEADMLVQPDSPPPEKPGSPPAKPSKPEAAPTQPAAAETPRPSSSRESRKMSADQMRPDSQEKKDFVYLLEKSLALRFETLGPSDPETVKTWKLLCTEYNMNAMRRLHHDDYEEAVELLEKAKSLVTCPANFGQPDDRHKLLAITYNNLSCVYKRRGFFKIALRHAEQALQIETMSGKWDNPAVTHLNLCAILSRVGRHEHALQHCQCALKLIRAGHFRSETPGLYNEATGDTGLDKDEGEAEIDAEEAERRAGHSLVAVCYFNMAVEQEHLRRLGDAKQSYKLALAECVEHCGPDHPTTIALRGSCATAVSNIEEQQAAARKGKATPRGTGTPRTATGRHVVNVKTPRAYQPSVKPTGASAR